LEGAKKLKLLPTPWPNDDVPPATASLLAVAPKRGLLAAAGPDTLILAYTENVRKAFKKEAGDNDVVTDFTPDVTLPVPQLRHVVFSADEDFLVISAENGGGLAVFAVEDLLQQKNGGEQQIETAIAVRTMLPNPAFAQYMAVIQDSGRMDIIDITNGSVKTVKSEGVTCAAWSLMGKAFVAGFADGTATVYMAGSHDERGRIPLPPETGKGYTSKFHRHLNTMSEVAYRCSVRSVLAHPTGVFPSALSTGWRF
jgi:nucleoporin NUP159